MWRVFYCPDVGGEAGLKYSPESGWLPDRLGNLAGLESEIKVNQRVNAIAGWKR